LYAWDHPGVPVEEVTNDIIRIFHHPAIRDERVEIQRNMYNTVRKWVDENPERGNLNNILSSSSVKAGLNHRLDTGHSHNTFRGLGEDKTGHGSAWKNIVSRDLGDMEGSDNRSAMSYLSPSPRAGSPASPCRTPDYGYNSSQFPPPQSFGSQTLQPEVQQAYAGYQQGPSSMGYPSYSPQVAYPAPYQQGAPGGYWPQHGPGYPNQPPYGGAASQYP
jgi:Heterokaryon incompatibility protein Het-C